MSMSIDARRVEGVLAASGLPDAEISARVADIGHDAVAEVLLAEIVDRAALLTAPSEQFVVQCDLGFGGERLGYLLRWGDNALLVEKGWDAEAAVTIRQDLIDLLREIFGPMGPCTRVL
jgi:demethylmacrocin O-methyltransferase